MAGPTIVTGMSALTSLLARDRIVPVSKIEEALQHQVIAGGDIETVLLEMNLVAEDVLSAYRAALYDRLPATREETMRASRDAIRTLPRDLARSTNAIPLQVEGRTMVVAVSEPLSAIARAQISAAVGCEISERIVTRPRFAAALAHHYGFELDPRMRRLTDALRRRDAGVIPFVRPPGPSLRPSTPVTTGDAGYSRNPFEDRPDTLQYPVIAPVRSFAGKVPVGISLSEPSLEADPENDSIQAIIPLAPKAVTDPAFNRFRLSTVPPSHVSTHAARAARGPMDEERARHLLAQAIQRDDVLFILLRYAQQFFDFVGVFSISKEGARGRMAHGAGLSAELMEHVVMPVEGPGLVARAVRDRRVLIGDLSASEEERAAAALLGRPSGPGIAVPIVIGSRAVLLLYADRAGEGLAQEDATEVLALVQPVADALKRIIVEQKTLRRSSLPPVRTSVAPDAPVPPIIAELLPEATSEQSQAAIERLSDVQDEDASPSRLPASNTPSGGFDLRNPHASESGLGLEAVDLDRLSRVPERRRETQREHAAAREPGVSRKAREAARGRVQGVPRTAPPPPVRESLAPAAAVGRADGSYHYASPTGAVLEESTRPKRSQPQAPAPLGVEVLAPSAAVGASFAQVKPRRIEVEKPRAEVLPAPVPVPSAAVRESQARIGRPADSEGTHRVPEERPSLAERTAHDRSSVTTLPMVIAPSVIIDMGDQVTALVESLLHTKPEDEPDEIAELVKVGEAALPVLLQLFPGPLWFDRTQPHKRRPRGRDVSAVARAIVAFGGSAAPYLASKVQSTDPNSSFYALMVAAEIPHLDLLDAVARRALDQDEAIRRLALETLRRFSFLAAFETVLSAFAQLCERPGKDPRRQRLAVEALGELRDRRSLKVLLARLSDPSEAVVQAAHRALVLLTCQDFGLAQRKWETWAEQWASSHRVEWLIDSLLHSHEAARARAGEELKHATQQYFGYHPQLPKRDRELAQRKYREWWEQEGRSAFGA